jgi:hypothetical protein
MKFNKTLFIYGLIGGILGVSLFLGPIVVSPEYYLESDNFSGGEVVGYTVMLLSMIPVYFGTRAYRNKFHKETFSFLKGLGSAMRITLISSLVFYIGNVLLYEVIAPDFLNDFAEVYHDYMLESAKTAEEIEAVNAEFGASNQWFRNSYLYGLLMTVSVFLFGLIISLISALVLRRNDESQSLNTIETSDS